MKEEGEVGGGCEMGGDPGVGAGADGEGKGAEELVGEGGRWDSVPRFM